MRKFNPLGEEDDIKLPLYLSYKREMLESLKGLLEAFEEEEEKRMQQILYESCSSEVIKFNTGFISALHRMKVLLNETLQEIQKKE